MTRRPVTAMRRGRIAGVIAVIIMACGTAAAAQPVDLAFVASDGRAMSVADFRGRWLLVNWWATWCSSCAAEMPALSRLAEREPALAIVGLTNEPLDDDTFRAFLAGHPVSYPVARVVAAALPDAIAPKAFGIGMRPISYLVAPDGVVVERIIGEVDVAKVAARTMQGSR